MNGGAGSPAYQTGSVTSRDGTTIGYRQLGRGPGVIAVHGGMQAAQNLMKLARALADSFTIYRSMTDALERQIQTVITLTRLG